LKVDALAQAIGGDQGAPFGFGELNELFLTFIVTDIAGDRLDMQTGEFPGEMFLRWSAT
jgi:hypothetical protein